MLVHSVRRLVVAVLVTAAAGFVVPLAAPVAPASAATCSSSTGVTVVVDFQELGGGLQGSCVTDGAGQRASALFPDAGFPLNVQTPGNPGYVCQVSGKPAGCSAPDDQAYWSLWWSTGDGTWTYSSYGVSSLKVPAGAWVGLAWKQGPGDAVAPAVTPTTPASPSPSPSPSPSSSPGPSSTPTPSPAPTSQPTPSQQPGQTSTTSPTQQPSSVSPSLSATTTPTAAPTTATPTPTPGATTVTPEPTGTPSVADPVVADPTTPTAADSDGGGGLPGWLAVLVIALLFAVAGVVALLKRRQATP